MREKRHALKQKHALKKHAKNKNMPKTFFLAPPFGRLGPPMKKLWLIKVEARKNFCKVAIVKIN